MLKQSDRFFEKDKIWTASKIKLNGQCDESNCYQDLRWPDFAGPVKLR